MTATHIGTVTSSTFGEGGAPTYTASLAAHASTQVGDLLIWAISYAPRSLDGSTGTPTINAPLGWTAVVDSAVLDSGTNRFYGRVAVFIREAATAGAVPYSVTVTCSAGHIHPVASLMSTWRGHKTIASGGPFAGGVGAGFKLIADAADTSSSLGRTVDLPSVTPNADNGMIVCFGVVRGSIGGYPTGAWQTVPSGMTTLGASLSDAVYEEAVVAGAYQGRTTGATGARTGVLQTQTATITYPWEVGVTLVLAEPNVAPLAPTLLSPTGGIAVNRAAAIPLRWQHNDPDTGDDQSAADIRYRVVGAGSWTTVTNAAATGNEYSIQPTLAAGDYEWQARTYDEQGVVGPYSSSAFFTAADVPTAPVITSHTVDETIPNSTDSLIWTHSTQDGFQVRKLGDSAGSPDTGNVLYDSGTTYETDAVSRQLALTFPVNGRTEHLQVRVKDGGLWSSWATVRVIVDYTPPDTPSVAVAVHQVDGVDAALQITVTNP